MGYKYPPPKTSRLADSVSQTAGGRPPGRPPTVDFSTVGGSRSTARSTAQKQRAELSGPVDHPVDRPMCLARRAQAVHVDRPPGRPAPGSVDRAVDRQGLSGTVLGQKNMLKIFLKITQKLLKITKNSFIILH